MTGKPPKYELLYREGRDVCGPPFQQFVNFFENFNRKNCRVLDLGCGQGRDALFIAQKGHTVFGVDLSETGISQMLEDAQKQGLNIDGEAADIVEFVPDGNYDVILLDRVLHMLKNHDERIGILAKVSRHTKWGGFMLIADTPKNMASLMRFFDDRRAEWKNRLEENGFLIYEKVNKSTANYTTGT